MKKRKFPLYIPEKKDFSTTPEAEYVKSLPWRWRGIDWAIYKVPQYTVNKLRDIFRLWGIGWHSDLTDCKNGQFNVFVDQRQWLRAGIIFQIPETEENKDESVQELR